MSIQTTYSGNLINESLNPGYQKIFSPHLGLEPSSHGLTDRPHTRCVIWNRGGENTLNYYGWRTQCRTETLRVKA